MKHNGKILLSLLLVSVFGISRALVGVQLNDDEFIKNRKKFLDAWILEHEDHVKALNNSVNDLGLESGATNLISRVVKADRKLMDLVNASLLLKSSVASVCTYNKISYNKLTSLGPNITKATINDEFKILEEMVNIISPIALEAEKFVDKVHERVSNFFVGVSGIQEKLRSLGVTQLEAHMEGFIKLYSEMKSKFIADEELVSGLKKSTEATQQAVKLSIEYVLSGDQSTIVRLSEEITSALREISSACIKAKSD